MRHLVALVSCTMLVCAAAARSTVSDGVGIVEVANGFTWAENIRCDTQTDALFVSEYRRGQLYKVCLARTDSMCGQLSATPLSLIAWRYGTQITNNGGYNSTVHVGTPEWDLFAGLAIHDATGVLYAVARETSTKDCWIISVDKVLPNRTTKVAKLPKLANGLAISQKVRGQFTLLLAPADSLSRRCTDWQPVGDCRGRFHPVRGAYTLPQTAERVRSHVRQVC